MWGASLLYTKLIYLNDTNGEMEEVLRAYVNGR